MYRELGIGHCKPRARYFRGTVATGHVADETTRSATLRTKNEFNRVGAADLSGYYEAQIRVVHEYAFEIEAGHVRPGWKTSPHAHPRLHRPTHAGRGVTGGERVTRLPAACCDAIFMRRVYHHLAAPSAILTSIHEALRPGGRLVIIDFRRDGIIGIATGMGANRADVIRAAAMIGFEVVTVDEWPGWDHYVVMFEKSHRARVGAP